MKPEQITRELNKIKNEIEDAKTKKIQYEARLDDLNEQLKEQFNCDSVSEGKKLLKKLKTKLEIDKTNLANKTETLINTFNENE